MSSLLIFLDLGLVITSCSEQPYYAGEASALNSNAVIDNGNGASIEINSTDSKFSLKAHNSSNSISVSATKNKQASNGVTGSSSNILNISESDGAMSFRAGNSSDSLSISAKNGNFSIQSVSQ